MKQMLAALLATTVVAAPLHAQEMTGFNIGKA